MSEVLYRLENVRKRNSDSFTLDVAHLEINRGETLCLVGPTGAGKSTLLRLLSLLDAPTEGNVSFANVRSPNWPLSTLRRITTVAQKPVMLNDTVRSNVAFGLRVRGTAAISQRVDQLLKLLRLDTLSERNARSLSGGEAQLVGLARALVIEPDVLLLDEPTAHLDPAHVALVEDVVQSQTERAGSTVVWVTHNLFQARRQGGRTALLLGGKLVEVTDTATFFDRPSHPTTAEFVQGKMVY